MFMLVFENNGELVYELKEELFMMNSCEKHGRDDFMFI